MIFKATRRLGLIIYYLTCVLVIVVCVLLLSLRYFLNPALANQKERIGLELQRLLTDHPGAEVRIGDITFGTNIYRNFLNIDEVSVIDGDAGNELSYIENVYIEMSYPGLYRRLRGEQMSSPVRLVLLNPRLSVVRRADGGLSVGGLRVDADKAIPAGWKIPLGQVIVDNAAISFEDMTGEFESQTLTHIDFAAEHQSGDILFSLKGTGQSFGNVRLTAQVDERALTTANPAGAGFHFELGLFSFESGELRFDRGILRVLGSGTLGKSGADIHYKAFLSQGSLASEGGAVSATQGSMNGRLKVDRSPARGWTVRNASGVELSGIEADIPAAIMHPQKIDSLTASFGFVHSSAGWRAMVQDATAENKEARLGFTFEATGGPAEPVRIDFAGSSRTPMAATLASKYLPTDATETVAAWLDAAVRKGSVASVDVSVRGRPEEFPYAGGEDGEFRLAIRFEGADFEYWPGWPALSAAEGAVVFEDKQMRISLDAGTVGGIDVAGSQALIPDLLVFDEQVLVTLVGKAGGGALLAAIDTLPPLKRFDLTRQVELLTKADVSVGIGIPIRRVEDISVEGRFGLNGGEMRLPGLGSIGGRPFALDDLDLDVTFSKQTAQVRGAGSFLENRTQVDAEIGFEGWQAELATSARIEEWLAKTGSFMGQEIVKGSTSIVVRAASDGTLELTSDLLGVEVALPAPLGKPASEARPVRLVRRTDATTVDYGKGLLQMRLLSDGLNTRVLAGINKEAPAAEVPGDYVLRGAMSGVDLDPWLDYATAEGGDRGHVDVMLETSDATFGGRVNKWFRIEMSADKLGTAITVDAEHVAGALTISRNEDGELVAVANLDRLRIGEEKDNDEEEEPAEEAGEERPPPRNFPELPRLVLAAQEVQVGKRNFGKISIEGSPSAGTWTLERLVSERGENILSAAGTSAMEGDPRSAINFTMAIGDIQQFMRDWGAEEEAVSEGQAEISGQVSWNDSLLRPAFDVMDGEVTLVAHNARFANAKTGIFKLMRLLTPDVFLNLGFSETLREGIKFESVSADFRIRQGFMSTENLVAASDDISVELSGGTDLDKETLDFRGKVRPGLAAVNALLGATMIATAPAAPVSAIVGWLAGKILKEPIDAIKEPFFDIGSYEYRIIGTWDEPVYEEIRS